MRGTKITKVPRHQRSEEGVAGRTSLWHWKPSERIAHFVFVRQESRALQATSRNPYFGVEPCPRHCGEGDPGKRLKNADPADQDAAEYERQSMVHKSNTAPAELHANTNSTKGK